MKIAFYGSSLVSSYWNGAATYYRGLLRALAARGHAITFYEPDVYDRQANRDIPDPDWCRVVVYPGTPEGVDAVLARAGEADVVVKASGVGYADDALLGGILTHSADDAIKIFWDVDAPATLAELDEAPGHPLHDALPRLDAVFTYGGGHVVVDAYQRCGARKCVPIYNALDPETHHPAPPSDRFAGSLGFLGNRLPDRESRVEAFFFEAARRAPDERFVLGGSGWDERHLPENVHAVGHVGTAEHNAFNASPQAVLNISRESMARTGYSPATRVFEAAGAGACLITDAWEGIDHFLKPDTEVLVAQDGREVAAHLAALTPERAKAIGNAARRRVLADHTYADRAVDVESALADLFANRKVAAE